MSYTQIIALDGVTEEQALHDHVSAWDAEQSGAAPGYLGARVFADQDAPGRYLVEVDFTSVEDAKRNNDRPETAAWADQLRGLAGRGEPGYQNLRQVCTTYR
jgi:quinol monooxygenase YgiN